MSETHVPAGGSDGLLLRLIAGKGTAAAEAVRSATASDDSAVLVAAALLSGKAELLVRAGAIARSSRDRQLVVLAGAHLRGDVHLFDALVRDHLAEHPGDVVAAWMASSHT